MTTWTNIPKASGTSWTNISKPSTSFLQAGSPIAAGFFLYLTYANSTGTSWTNITKPSGTIWTNIPKAI